jgi:hypothetical protein
MISNSFEYNDVQNCAGIQITFYWREWNHQVRWRKPYQLIKRNFHKGRIASRAALP